MRELERASGMTQQQAREQLLKETEDDVRHDMAKLIRRVEEEAKQESDRRVRSIISTGIGRLAASHAAATTVSMVELASDDMKGRIIGREGRNIRALETITGVRRDHRRHARHGDPVRVRRRAPRDRAG